MAHKALWSYQALIATRINKHINKRRSACPLSVQPSFNKRLISPSIEAKHHEKK